MAALDRPIERDAALCSLPPEDVLSVLDLSGAGLEAARRACLESDRLTALGALLAHYRECFPLPEVAPELDDDILAEADCIARHVFRWGPYDPADYGEDIDWEWDPAGDIEWVAAVYRFYWAAPLAAAFAGTRDERYARAFIELTSDWIRKHPLETRLRSHPVYTNWHGFAWLDIQTGIRATNLCQAFRVMAHASSFTPEFLGVLLASLYDHQVKTERIPMGVVHNKAIFEQRGFVNVAHTFREFRDSKRWLCLGLERASENLLAQTTSDGVQTEWAFGYHCGVLRDALEMLQRARHSGVDVPDAYRDRVKRMMDYLFAVATPELAGPMFGDSAREPATSDDRRRWQLYAMLVQATELLDDSKYRARAELDVDALPSPSGAAFPEAATYVMRDRWGPDQVYFALHCPAPGCSQWHDQPDNGTFELYAFGRWLMPDTGYYTYGHDPEGRAWHRQTRVHQTLTLDDADSAVAGRHLLWHSAPDLEALAVENDAYGGLTHRRTVWFVERRFFVLLDEAVGDASGQMELHFQFAPGSIEVDAPRRSVRTCFEDANVLLWTAAAETMAEEQGWFAWSYGHRVRRPAVRVGLTACAPASAVTVLVPYRGRHEPALPQTASVAGGIGAETVSVRLRAWDRTWELGRDIGSGRAWCRKK